MLSSQCSLRESQGPPGSFCAFSGTLALKLFQHVNLIWQQPAHPHKDCEMAEIETQTPALALMGVGWKFWGTVSAASPSCVEGLSYRQMGSIFERVFCWERKMHCGTEMLIASLKASGSFCCSQNDGSGRLQHFLSQTGSCHCPQQKGHSYPGLVCVGEGVMFKFWMCLCCHQTEKV